MSNVPALKPLLWQKTAPLATGMPTNITYLTPEWDGGKAGF